MQIWQVVVITSVVLLVSLVIKMVQVIPQASAAVVERFGRYTRTLHAGPHILVPVIDTIRNRVDLREQVVPFPPQPVMTHDHVVVNIDVVIYYQVTDVHAATYGIASYIQGIEQLITSTLRDIVRGMDLERTLTIRAELSAALHSAFDNVTGTWGIRVNRVQVKTIEPPTSIQESMERYMCAERDKQASILAAETAKQVAVLQAEAEHEVAAIRAQKVSPGKNALPWPGRDSKSAAMGALPAHEPLRSEDPHRIGRYILLSRLGQGGMGTVYLGRSPGGRLVAVKLINQEHSSHTEFRRRFAREVNAVRQVGGFFTAHVVAAEPDGDQPWLVTEYIPGPSLREVLRYHGPLPVNTVLNLAAGIAEALDWIHKCGIIHRDLKPSNIILSLAGPRVIDFGIARMGDGTPLTSTNAVVGTKGFLAPEQYNGSALSPATDVYALGMVLCHAAGVAPFPDGLPIESALRMLPSALSSTVARCLESDPVLRPTPAQILEEFTSAQATTEAWLPPPVRTLVELHASRMSRGASQ